MANDIMRSHNAVTSALREGKLIPGPCEHEADGVCKGRIEAHHDDYTKPLDVRWLCKRHHMRFHAENPQPDGGKVEATYSNGGRTVRSRIPKDLAAAFNAAMEFEERTESDIVRRALRAYLFGNGTITGSNLLGTVTGSKPFRGPDPRKK